MTEAGAAPKRSRLRRGARLALLNALVLLAGALLAGGGAEVYFRVTTPFRTEVRPVRFVPGVGLIRPPNAEVRATNGLDFWQATHTNSLGFLDREPPAPERAATSCHVAFIGDSFVETKEVPVASKAHVQLEKMAMREAPELDVTTSAFGRSGTGQINQLAFYDAFARRLSPDVVVLVAVDNDFHDNSLPFKAYFRGFHPDYPPHFFARRGADGEMEFVPPADGRDFGANRLPALPPLEAASTRSRVAGKLREWSYLADRLFLEFGGNPWLVPPREGRLRALERRVALISLHPLHGAFALGWNEAERFGVPYAPFLEENPPPAFRDALDVMRFALERFRERAERDGAALVILASHTLGGEGDALFELLRAVVDAAGGGGGNSHH